MMNTNEQIPTADNTGAQLNNSNELNIEPSDQLQLDQSSDLLLDEFLMTALRSVKDRPALLKIELEIERFVQDTSQSHVTFPPMSSYHRLMVHKAAHHWGLQHLTGVIQGSGPQPAKYVRVERGSVTTAPIFRLRELCESDVSVSYMTPVNTTPAPTPVTAPVKVSPSPSPGAVKLLLRRNEAKNSTGASQSGSLPNQASASRDQASDSPSLEEREAAYAKARARIFSEQQALENAAKNSAMNHSVNGTNTAVSGAINSKATHEDDEWYDASDLPNWEEDEASEYRRDLSARYNPSVSHVTRPALVEQLDRLQLNDATRVTSVKPTPAPTTRVTAPSTQEQVAKLGHILEVTGLTDLTSAPYLGIVDQLKDVATIKQLPNKEGQSPRVVAIFSSSAQAQSTMTSFNERNNSVQLQTMTARVTPVNVSFNSQAPNKSVNRPVNPRPAPNPAYSQPYYPNPTMTPVNPYQQYYPVMTPVNQTPPYAPVNYHPAMYAQYPPNTAPNPPMYPHYYYPNPQYYTNPPK
eukprot:TRINITY_DN3623_c0_g3_i1.p1 TRINITY_DN3623_c0_g3~~TRINITY_DN3623_c0_g3_i1.p1  ORF type:complete len:523 (+),score=157.12 TRINITY_DN3623_c0_g3_i1:81-1649(+)